MLYVVRLSFLFVDHDCTVFAGSAYFSCCDVSLMGACYGRDRFFFRLNCVCADKELRRFCGLSPVLDDGTPTVR